MAANGTTRIGHSVTPSIPAAPHPSPEPTPSRAAPNAQSSISPSSIPEQKGFVANFLVWMRWILARCGICSNKQSTTTATPVQTQPAASQQQQQAPAAPARVPARATPSATPTIRAPAPIATTPAAAAAVANAQLIQGINTIEQQITALSQDTPENRYTARELRWMLQAIKAQLNQADPANVQTLARIATLDGQLLNISGLGGVGPINLTEALAWIDEIENTELPRMQGVDEDERLYESLRLRDGHLFILKSALDPQNPLHLPYKEKISRLSSQLDGFIANNNRVKVVKVEIAEELLEQLENEAQRATLSYEEDQRRAQSTKITEALNLSKRVLHPTDARHEPLREIMARIETHLATLAQPMPLLPRALCIVNEANESHDDYLQDDDLHEADYRHEALEFRWKLQNVKAELNPTDAAHGPVLQRIDALEHTLIDYFTHFPAVNALLIQTKLAAVETAINNLNTSHPDIALRKREADRLMKEDLFRLNEALVPSEPAHLPLKAQAVRLYQTLFDITGERTYPEQIAPQYAEAVLAYVERRAGMLPDVNSRLIPRNERVRSVNALKDELNILQWSIGSETFDHLRQRVDAVIALLNT